MLHCLMPGVGTELLLCSLLLFQPIVGAFALDGENNTNYAATVAKPKLLTLTPCAMISFSLDRMITTLLINNSDNELPFAIFLEVRDMKGVTLFLAFHIGSVHKGDKTEIASSWQLPQESAQYELRAFAISNFTKPTVIANVNSVKVDGHEADCIG